MSFIVVDIWEPSSLFLDVLLWGVLLLDHPPEHQSQSFFHLNHSDWKKARLLTLNMHVHILKQFLARSKNLLKKVFFSSTGTGKK